MRVNSINIGFRKRKRRKDSFSWSSFWKSQLYSKLDGDIIKKSDGYYLEDSSGNENDAKLVESYSQVFGADASYIELATAETTLTPLGSGITIYEFIMKVDDESEDGYILYNGASFAGWGGVIIKIMSGKFWIQLSNQIAVKEYTSVNVIDNNWHTYKFTIDGSATKKLTIDVDGVLEEFDIDGGNYATSAAKGFKVGFGGVCTRFTLARFRVTKGGTIVFDSPFQTNIIGVGGSSDNCIDRVSGNIYDSYSCTVTTQDVYPGNILNGYELYKQDISPYRLYYIPRKIDGDYVTPVRAGYTKVGEFAAGNGHNFCETKIKIGDDNLDAGTLLNLDYGKYFGKTTGTLLTDLYITNDVQSDVNIRKALDLLEYPSDNVWYGIEYDTTESAPEVTRIGEELTAHYYLPLHRQIKGCLLNDDGTVNYYLDPHDWTKKANGQTSVLDGTDGQVMVEIPAHYIKYETAGTTNRVKVSLAAFTGATAVSKTYISAYKASLNRTTEKLSSVINLSTDYRGGDNTAAWDAADNTLLGKAVTSFTRPQFRTYARNRGSVNWNMMTYDAAKSLYWLYLIEYATRQEQEAVSQLRQNNGYRQGGLGNGPNTLASRAADVTTFNGGNPIIPIGTSNSLGNYSGEVSYTILGFPNADPVMTVNRYRGIEIPFGEIISLIDGINIKHTNGVSAKGYIISDPSHFADNTIENSRELPSVLPIITDFSLLQEIMFGDNGDIMCKVAGGTSNPYLTHFCQAYHSYSVVDPVVDDYWYRVWLNNDMIACGTTGASAGFIFQWTRRDNNDSAVTVGTRLVYIGE